MDTPYFFPLYLVYTGIVIYFVLQSAFMEEQQKPVETLNSIRDMMERSSRFISLSGLSGVSAGICALAGAWLAYGYIHGDRDPRIRPDELYDVEGPFSILLNDRLFWIAIGTFLAAFISAFFFTWLKSRKEGIPVWGSTARRLMINVSIPMIVGAVFLVQLVEYGTPALVAPGCLIFYGLGLLNASRYTLPEIRYLALVQLALGLINLRYAGLGLLFWTIGFGVMHIVYGLYMWWKYERQSA